MQKPALLELTSTRFFAAMAVLLGHFNEYLGLPSWLSGTIAGGFGVSFFFVLSGFILCYRYWEDFEDGVKGDHFRRYFVARIARVYPSYAMALMLFTAMYVLLNVLRPGIVSLPANPVSSWLSNLFALQTFAPSYETQQYWNAPGWSISTEFGFYLACPFILAGIAAKCRGLRPLLAFYAIVVAVGIVAQAATLYLVLGRGWNREFWLDIVASRNIFWRLPEFVTGVVAARLLYGGRLKWHESAGARNILLVAGIVAVVILNVAPWPTENAAVLIMRQFRLDLAYMVPFAAIVFALAAGPTIVSPLLKRPTWVFLGGISYAVYIYHWIPWTLLAIAKAAGRSLSVPMVTAVVALIILGSAVSYLWYERPARMFIRRKFGQ